MNIIQNCNKRLTPYLKLQFKQKKMVDYELHIAPPHCWRPACEGYDVKGVNSRPSVGPAPHFDISEGDKRYVLCTNGFATFRIGSWE